MAVSRGQNDRALSPRRPGPVLMACFVLFFLWDYYLPAYGLRPFDAAGFALLLLWTVLPPNIVPLLRTRVLEGLAFLLIVSVFLFGAIRGVAAGNSNASLAVLVGLSVLWIVYRVPLHKMHLLKLVDTLLLVQVATIALQWVLFIAVGAVLNYHAWLAWEPPRVYGDIPGYFRPAGLFLEPNSYSLATFTLLALKHRIAGRGGLISYLALGSMLLSQSLWGMGVAAIAILILYSNWFIRIAGVAAILWLPRDLIFRLLALFGTNEVTIARIQAVSSDPSAIDRYLIFFSQLPDLGLRFAFGSGISSLDFQTYAGANSFSYFLYSFGLVGLFLFVLSYGGIAFRPARVLALLSTLLAMTTYPLWSYLYWWVWIGLLARRYWDEKSSDVTGGAIAPAFR